MTVIAMALSQVSVSFDTFHMSKRFAREFQLKTSIQFFNCAERKRDMYIEDWVGRGGVGTN